LVELGCLAAFDYLHWLRTGARAADLLNCHQSTISRDAKKCQRIFGVSLTKKSAEWRVSGDITLLNAERHVHQKYRWDHDLPLRLDGQHWMRDSYSALALQGWIKGNLNYLEYEQPRSLLKQHVIDGWLCSAPDHPDDPELTPIRLCSMPCQLTVKNCHPLAEMGPSLTLDHVRAYPLLPLPVQSFPVFASLIKSLGLDGQGRGDARHSSLPVEDLLIGIASPLTLPSYGPDHVVLPIELPIVFGDVLVVPAEFAEHPRTRALVQELVEHLRVITAGMADIVIREGVGTGTSTGIAVGTPARPRSCNRR
jgi:DNA-binding transcriptional LysR family regulator